MIEGMRMDLVKSRYNTFSELYEYCYRVAGTVALMSTPIMGIDPRYKVRQLRQCIHTASSPIFSRSRCSLWRDRGFSTEFQAQRRFVSASVNAHHTCML